MSGKTKETQGPYSVAVIEDQEIMRRGNGAD
jgi:hypothetical protein